MNVNTKIELLAPAKDKICAKAAIDCGADAVYIGASEFGARKNVPNSIDDIKEVVEYAHQFDVKVFVAINTILTDEELPRAEKLIEELAKIDVDAIIVQDMGLIQNTKCKMQNVIFHASTQCDNRTVEKVQFLQSVGFSRVVLARELSLAQIKEIKENTDVELEVFIHGALCICYSGQCYLSHAIGQGSKQGGRSANRGECAQPCRKKYSLLDADGNYIVKDKYLLNLKDFNASKHIKELAEIGVTSLKIEGRLKDENYVRNVVGYYRKLIDDLGLGKTSSGNVIFDFEPNLEKTFNRGYSDYFLNGKRKVSNPEKEIFNFDSPKFRGEYIGKISKVTKDYFELDKKIELNSQDGLCFFNNEELQGCLVNKVEGTRIFPNKMDGIKIGAEIYRNFDSKFEKLLKTSKTCRKIGVDIEFDLGKITAVDETGSSAKIKYDFEELAQNTLKMQENIITQLKKSGDTIFSIKEVKIRSEKLPFLPVSKLNELRRELLEKLIIQRLEKNKSIRHPEVGSGSYNVLNPKLDYKANILNKKAKDFYEQLGFEVKELALESGKVSAKGKAVMRTKHCIKHALNMCKSDKTLFLVDEKGKKYELKFDCKKCEMAIVF